MGTFWAWALIVIALALVVTVLLYALALWAGAREESYWETVWGLVKQIATGDFW
jgi:hypothetical protein